MEHNYSELITTFYQAFAQEDADTMAACYAPDAQFQDPAFGPLHGNEVPDMWRMLLSRSGGELAITFDKVWAEGNQGGARWEARYVFGPKKRPVHNIIEARFKFRDGKIVQHTDTFSFWRWARQALGLPGLLLGWTPSVKNKVRNVSHKALHKYQILNNQET